MKDAVFYQVFPDRFAQSDRVAKPEQRLESWDSPPTAVGFEGGDQSLCCRPQTTAVSATQ